MIIVTCTVHQQYDNQLITSEYSVTIILSKASRKAKSNYTPSLAVVEEDGKYHHWRWWGIKSHHHRQSIK
eukprot:scaffold24979_cov89-Skeletonema_dohrnii-CCMP3373.AAC.1